MQSGLAPTITLTHGAELPQLGLGTWPLTDDQVERAVRQAVASGAAFVRTPTPV